MGRTIPQRKARRRTRPKSKADSSVFPLVRVRWITHKNGRKMMIPLVGKKSASKGRLSRKRGAKRRGDELDAEYASHTFLDRRRERESSVASLASEASTHTLG